MDIIKLQTRHRPRVADQAAVHLPAAQIPQPHHAIRGAARQRRLKHLQGAHKIRRHVRRARRLAPGAVARSSSRGERRRLRGGPHDIQRLHAPALLEVPLAQRLVGGPGHEHVVAEVQRRDLVEVRLQREERAVGHAAGGRVDGLVVRVLERDGVLVVVFAVLAEVAALRVVVRPAEVPEADGGVHGACG
jgi:hypothetical protein